MAEPLQIAGLPQPRRLAELSPEAQIHKSYKCRFKHTEPARVVNVAFCPTAPHHLAVVSGTKVGLWHQKKQDNSWEAGPGISKFKDLTQCVSYRNDGKLLLAGEASGSCALVEVETRKLLRRFRGHGGDAVTCCSFASSDRSRAATGARDGKLRLWDVTTSDLLLEVDAHSDCMKSLHAGAGGPDAWISAGYDGRVKVWDLREASGTTSVTGDSAKKCCVASMNHGHQIEAGVVYPGGTMYASAGGQAVKVWDLVAGGKPVVALADAHAKAITGLSLDSTASALLTASFDGLAKVFHAASLSHIFTHRLPGPATCVAWRPDDDAFVVGLDDGQWQLRERKTAAQAKALAKATAVAAKQKPFRKREGRLRGTDAKPGDEDEVMDMQRPAKKKMKNIDFFLKKFEYRKVIEWLANPSVSRGDGLAVIDELLQRGALNAALSNLGEELCLDMLKWILRCFASAGDSLQEHLIFEALHTLLDGNRCLQPPTTLELTKVFEALENKVNSELRVQEAISETSGMLEAVMSF